MFLLLKRFNSGYFAHFGASAQVLILCNSPHARHVSCSSVQESVFHKTGISSFTQELSAAPKFPFLASNKCKAMRPSR
jgi:hypothetical protein